MVMCWIKEHQTPNCTKVMVMNWHSDKKPYSLNMLKPQLYRFIYLQKLQYKHSVHKILTFHGHITLRIPTYHLVLNLIENIWAQSQQNVGTNNITFKISIVQRLCEEKFAQRNERKADMFFVIML